MPADGPGSVSVKNRPSMNNDFTCLLFLCVYAVVAVTFDYYSRCGPPFQA